MIVAAGVDAYALRLRRPWTTATGATTARRGFLFWMEDDEGRVGWGDAAPLPGASRFEIDHAYRALTAMARAAAGATQIEGVTVTEEASTARHARVQANMGLQALAKGRPLCDLLRRWTHTKATRSFVRVNKALPILGVAATVKAARAAHAAGYRTIKLKVGTAASDVARVRAVRDALGSRVRIRLDANGAWTPTRAAKTLARLRPFDIEYVEQPLAPGNVTGLAKLRRTSGVPIAADEGAAEVSDALKLFEHEAIDVVVIKPMALGGLDHAARLVAAARGAGVTPIVTDSLESAIGRAGALHLAATLDAEGPDCGLASGELLSHDVAPRFAIRGGRITVPRRPGLGVVPEGHS